MRELRILGRRALNAAKVVFAGLPLHAESVSPEVPNDLFQAHLSVYKFFAEFSIGRRVLDLGCGTGYGVDYLAAAGAREIVGVDRDSRAIRYATKRFSSSGALFLVADIAHLQPSLGIFDSILASNVFEHLDDPEQGLRTVIDHLTPQGYFVMVVPPIVDDASLQENLRNRFHRSNLFVREWLALLQASFEQVDTYRHLLAVEGRLDFSGPFPSRFSAGDFFFPEIPPERAGTLPSLGAVFVCRRAAPCGSCKSPRFARQPGLRAWA
jgi:SAM-dependent methyltransferase